MNILLAGGAGYIGSHTAVELLEAGHDVVIVDNYCNSSPEAVKRIEELSGKSVVSYDADVKDSEKMKKVFSENDIDCVIHFAGLKAVGESVQKPIEYYRNNIDTTLTLLECMREAGVHQFVFSSSATVYGEENDIPYVETMKKGSCSNPYGWTKSMMEQILEDAAVADKELSVVLLRYFNPIGAHKSGLIGENPNDIPNNLMPYIVKVANKELKELSVFGNDYDTIDGTGVRDYIHVVDLAKGHIKALNWVLNNNGIDAFNLGTGNGYSVLELVEAFKKFNNIDVPYKIVGRRDGDIASCYADASKAKDILDWSCTYNIEDMVKDSYNYVKNSK